MNDLFQPHLRHFVLVFFDDILVYSATIKQHLAHLKIALGHIILQEGAQVYQDKVVVIESWPVPTTVREVTWVLRFQCFTVHYQQFVKHYKLIARPLIVLTKKDGFMWANDTTITFNKLKQVLMAAPVLCLPDFLKPFISGKENKEANVLTRRLSTTQLSTLQLSSGNTNQRPGKEKVEPSGTKDQATFVKGVKLDQDKIAAITSWPIPTNMKWTEEAAVAFQQLKKLSLQLWRPNLRKSVHLTLLVSTNMSEDYEGLLVDHYTKSIIEAVNNQATYVPGAPSLCPNPNQIWEDVSMDFIAGFPPSNRIDTILVVVDRLSKNAHFLPLSHRFTARSVANVSCIEIVGLQGIPLSIETDSHVVFLSNFWQELFRLFGTN
ncbi:hypothetical protein E3N88_18222 [Mikania micrantha]|uniref:Integrase catalytic domain-containing protein n=1 Tax=Mikania micrantha TaxID=192012 RepID=A0A5N6NUA0_9ASTR|nr:hypothetical protein E3N88_18222 [Mikania micrantha]